MQKGERERRETRRGGYPGGGNQRQMNEGHSFLRGEKSGGVLVPRSTTHRAVATTKADTESAGGFKEGDARTAKEREGIIEKNIAMQSEKRRGTESRA